MSYIVRNTEFNPASNRILNQMLRRAGYVTGTMVPLSGPLAGQSISILSRFMNGVIQAADGINPPGPRPRHAFGQP